MPTGHSSVAPPLLATKSTSKVCRGSPCGLTITLPTSTLTIVTCIHQLLNIFRAFNGHCISILWLYIHFFEVQIVLEKYFIMPLSARLPLPHGKVSGIPTNAFTRSASIEALSTAEINQIKRKTHLRFFLSIPTFTHS